MSRTRAGKKALSLLVSESESMRAVVDRVEDYAEERHPVLVLGESGSGRELIARILHFVRRRRKGGFVTVHGGSAPRYLFRDPPGAASQSTLMSAAGGTLLIKDLCELPTAAQRRLERVFRNGDAAEHDALVIGSCDTDLRYAVEAGVFDGKLFEQFEARTIMVPALRERAADIPVLAAQMIKEYAREIGKSRISVSTRAYDRLVQYPWPGNVKELKGICRRLVYRASSGRIEPADVDSVLPVVAERVPLEQVSLEEAVKSKLATFLRQVDGYDVEGIYDDMIARVEKPMLELVMQVTGSNQLKAAQMLGLNRNTLRRKLTDHGLLARKGARRKASGSGAKGSRKTTANGAG